MNDCKAECVSIKIDCCGAGAASAPTIGENGNWYLGEEDTGISAKGQDGVTPHIGENGNWFLGDMDTGVTARGADGPQGPSGLQGPKGDKGDKGDGGLMEEVYSTTATRIGTWIDGRPLYRRAFRYEGTIPKSDGSSDVIVPIVTPSQVGSFQEIIKVYGRCINSATGATLPFPSRMIGSTYVPGEGVRFVSESYSVLRDVVVVLEYT